MGGITLKPGQEAAVNSLQSGSLLIGGVGSGKTYAGIFWAALQEKPIIIITTASKRDMIKPGHEKADWQESLELCGITNYIVDSWNNINKYDQVSQSVFVFDEQGASGFGSWAKTFIKIAKKNSWILMSATPADKWIHYMPIFIANGFYKNKTEFANKHIVYDPYVKYPSIKQYIGTAILEMYRKRITVIMDVPRHTKRHYHEVVTDFRLDLTKQIKNERWNIYEDKPIETAGEYTQIMRRIVAEDEDRIKKATQLIKGIPRVIVFYNYNYELDILINIAESLNKPYTQWNGKRHDNFSDGKVWVHFVQTNASEGWECISTDSMIFYSPTYAWRQFEQMCGRIDRSNTNYINLHYYSLISKAKIDKDVLKANREKRNFNETTWAKRSLK